ncbi:MAG: hypothetical protein IKC44_06525, partial [Burkholderiaceae bacterium]|nr:hypothetical protein [Burkholderiaceae bacterium]
GTNIIDVAVQNTNWLAVKASDVEMGLAYEKVCRPNNTRLFRNQSYNEVLAYTQTALRVTAQKKEGSRQ